MQEGSSNTRYIESLVASLRPVRPVRATRHVFATWLAVAGLAVLLVFFVAHLITPEVALSFRSPWAASSVRGLRNLAELLVALGAGAAAATASFELGLPGSRHARPLTVAAAMLAFGWVLLVVSGETHVSTAASVEKRSHCFIESLVMATLGCGAGLVLLARRVVLAPAWAGGLMGAASAALPAIAMQLACTTMPAHALRFHLSPIVLIAAGGALAGGWLSRLR